MELPTKNENRSQASAFRRILTIEISSGCIYRRPTDHNVSIESLPQ